MLEFGITDSAPSTYGVRRAAIIAPALSPGPIWGAAVPMRFLFRLQRLAQMGCKISTGS
jgi:hypothetical protein